MSNDMQREFASREELVAYLQEQFPKAAGRDRYVSVTVGGRKAAEKLLQTVDSARLALQFAPPLSELCHTVARSRRLDTVALGAERRREVSRSKAPDLLSKNSSSTRNHSRILPY